MRITDISEAVITEGRIVENRPLAAGTYLMRIDCPEVARAAGPGRFVKLRAWAENGGPLLDRPFSIHRATDGQVSVLYRVLGPATRLMSRTPAGGTAKISGPLGRGLGEMLPTKPEGMYLVAGGLGLAPMGLALDWLGAGRVSLFYGERSGRFQVDREWLSSWAGDFTATVDDGQGYGQAGLVTVPLEKALERDPRPVFACGPAPMLAAVSRLAARFGVTPWVSVEAGMACGFGVCLTCSLPWKSGGRFRVCQDGPVADGSAVDWEGVQ